MGNTCKIVLRWLAEQHDAPRWAGPVTFFHALLFCGADGYVRAEAVGALTLALASLQEPLLSRQGLQEPALGAAAHREIGSLHCALATHPPKSPEKGKRPLLSRQQHS